MFQKHALKEPITYTYSDDDTVVYTEIVYTRYGHNNNLAVLLMPESENPTEIIYISVNTMTFPPEKPYITLDVNSTVVNAVKDRLIEQGFIEITQLKPVKSGFVEYPTYKVNLQP